VKGDPNSKDRFPSSQFKSQLLLSKSKCVSVKVNSESAWWGIWWLIEWNLGKVRVGESRRRKCVSHCSLIRCCWKDEWMGLLVRASEIFPETGSTHRNAPKPSINSHWRQNQPHSRIPVHSQNPHSKPKPGFSVSGRTRPKTPNSGGSLRLTHFYNIPSKGLQERTQLSLTSSLPVQPSSVSFQCIRISTITQTFPFLGRHQQNVLLNIFIILALFCSTFPPQVASELRNTGRRLNCGKCNSQRKYSQCHFTVSIFWLLHHIEVLQELLASCWHM
jgi:hypothetical protein